MASYFLPTGKLHKKENIRKLNNLPKKFKADLYRNILDNTDGAFDSNFQK